MAPPLSENTPMSASLRAGRYGIDAPYAPLGMLAGAVACAAVAVFVAPQWWVSAIILTLMAGLYLHTTRRGKFLVWQRLLAAQPWRGDERVLDLGCGRGMVLLEVARHLPRGRAVGVDIWSNKDQSGNAMAAALANAEAEGVAARVELHTADMRHLPFADASFDAVVSNVAIHNIAPREGRAQAIDEAWRVLRPGGMLLLGRHQQDRRVRGQARHPRRDRHAQQPGLAHVVGRPVGADPRGRGTQARCGARAGLSALGVESALPVPHAAGQGGPGRLHARAAPPPECHGPPSDWRNNRSRACRAELAPLWLSHELNGRQRSKLRSTGRARRDRKRRGLSPSWLTWLA
ncbi:SAM-dependent methyltransferase [Pseudoxanthomonas winnipegensis]|nr:class I SAM-dependent methyltransferase [Pseudoxanthomonas winnipegensis]MDQ1134961.1 SAM-dependent methyltransferase [Pseudoxanthomonas winnipegensis]